MPRISEQVLVPYDPALMYELVRDVRRYPEFIKWVKKLDVSNEVHCDTHYSCSADVAIQFKGFGETFSTEVMGHPDKNIIDVKLRRGPFRHLRNRWQFDLHEDRATRVHFFMDYEFQNPVLSLLARANARLAADRIIEAFRTEAHRRHGPKSVTRSEPGSY